MVHSERRQHRRYLVEGKGLVQSPSREFPAQLVDIGKGGVLLLAGADLVAVGEQVRVRFVIDGYPVEIEARGRVARTDTHAIGIAFAEVPAEFDEAILWLEASFISTMF
jgi:hypothetical protein